MTFGKIQPIDEVLSSINVSSFIEDWNSGMTLVNLAKKYNFAYPDKAKSIAKALGLKMREIVSSTDELLSSINVSSFIEDWNSGMTLVNLAKKYNFAYPDKAKSIAKALGLKMIKRVGKPTSRIDELLSSINVSQFIEDWNSGMMLVNLANKYNLAYPDKAKRLAKTLGLASSRVPTSLIDESVDRDKFIEMYYDEKNTINKIKEEFGFSNRHVVKKFAKKIGLETTRKSLWGKVRMIKFDEISSEFSALWNEGVPKKEIAEKYGVTDATVSLWRKKLNLRPRPIGNQRIENTLAHKIEQLLLENDGALTKSEIAELLGMNPSWFVSQKFGTLRLIFGKTGSGKTKHTNPTKFFGDYSNDTIVFLKTAYDCLILKLAKILKSNCKMEISDSRLSTVIKYLSRQDRQIENRKHQLLETLQSEKKQKELEKFVAGSIIGILEYNQAKLDKKNQGRKRRGTTEDGSQDTSLGLFKTIKYCSIAEEIVSALPKRTFYGRKFNADSVIEEFDNAYTSEQINLLQEIFTPLNFLGKTPTEKYFDLELQSNVKYLVKLKTHQKIDKTDFTLFQQYLAGQNGFIFTLQDVPEEILTMCDQNVGVLTKNDLQYLLSHIQYLPIRKDAHAKIMAGDNKGKFVTIQEVDFTVNRATVLDLEKNEYDVLVSFLKNVYTTDSDSLSGFMSKLQKICNEADLLDVDEIEIDKFGFLGTEYHDGLNEKIEAEMEKQKVFVNLNPKQSITSYLKDVIAMDLYKRHYRELYSSKRLKVDGLVAKKKKRWAKLGTQFRDVDSLDYLRNKMTSCTCLAWASQYTNINLCRHQATLLYNLWKNSLADEKSASPEKQVLASDTKEKIFQFLDEIYFVTHVSSKIEEFWHDKIENTGLKHERPIHSTITVRDKQLIHYAICKLVLEVASTPERTEETFDGYDELFNNTLSKIKRQLHLIGIHCEEIQNKMTELKNEKPELFDNIEITDKDRGQILVTLDSFYTEKGLLFY